MEFISGYLWQKGAGDVNEDSLTIQQIRCKRKTCLMAVLCDGIGGLGNGETASGYVTEEMVKWFYEEVPQICAKRKKKKYIENAILKEFSRIQIGLREIAEKKKCAVGTTMTLLLMIENKGYLFHLGDSGLYRIEKNGKEQRLTERHEKNRILTKAMSSYSYQIPDMLTISVKKKQGFLLCSDGLWRYLEQEKMKECFKINEINNEEIIFRRLRELGNMVIRKGGKDDVSAIYIQSK